MPYAQLILECVICLSASSWASLGLLMNLEHLTLQVHFLHRTSISVLAQLQNLCHLHLQPETVVRKFALCDYEPLFALTHLTYLWLPHVRDMDYHPFTWKPLARLMYTP